MIEVRELCKHFGPLVAVDNVSFSVARGEVLGFLGPNGAGKSTTMKMITGFLSPSSGDIEICGNNVRKDPIKIKKSIGYLPEGAPSYPDMTPASFLEFIAEIRGFRGQEKSRRVQIAIEKARLESVLHQTIDTLSKGFKRRVGIAQCILHDPQVLIMDEPTDGLDPNQKHEVRTLIKEMAKDKAIVVSTHILEEMQAVCSRAIIIANGKILFDGTPGELESKSKFHNAMRLCITSGDADKITKTLKSLSSVKSIESNKQADGITEFVVFPKKGASMVKDVGKCAKDNNWEIDQMTLEHGNLDEVFRTITTGSVKSSKETLT